MLSRKALRRLAVGLIVLGVLVTTAALVLAFVVIWTPSGLFQHRLADTDMVTFFAGVVLFAAGLVVKDAARDNDTE